MALSPSELVAAIRAGAVEYKKQVGVSIAGVFVGAFVPTIAGVPIIVRAAA
jgi:hypothetical protein